MRSGGAALVRVPHHFLCAVSTAGVAHRDHAVVIMRTAHLRDGAPLAY